MSIYRHGNNNLSLRLYIFQNRNTLAEGQTSGFDVAVLVAARNCPDPNGKAKEE